MAKQRHQSKQQMDSTPSRTPMAFLVIGALLVAGLVVWALTRTVQAPTNVPTYTSEATTAAGTTYDTAGTTQPAETSPIAPSPITPSPIASTTAGIATSSHAPVIEGNKSEVPRISAEDLREKVKAGAVTVIDVRDISAFQAAHIPGSLHIPLASVEANLDRLPKGKPIVAYCT
jgi:hypothetical protein